MSASSQLRRTCGVVAFSALVCVAEAGDCTSEVGSTKFGAGSPGTSGVPELRGVGAPLTGSPFAVRIRGGRPDALGVVIASPNATPIFLPPFGATLEIGLPFIVQEGFGLDGAGRSEELFALSALPGELCGLEFTSQAFVVDPAAAGGLAFTNALRTRPGIDFGPLFAIQTYDTQGNEPHSVATAHLDGDPHLDAVVIHRVTGNAAVFLGSGRGELANPVHFSLGPQPRAAHLELVDADGFLDLIVLHQGADELAVYPGNGDGTFGAALTTAVGTEPHSLALGQLDAGGAWDLVVTNQGSDDVRVLLGQGDGTFVAGGTYSVGDAPADVELGDLDGDGNLDVVVVNSFDDTVSIRLGDGLGAFGAENVYPTQTLVANALSTSVVLGDWNDDGALDIAAGLSVSAGQQQPSLGSVALLEGHGDGTFEPAEQEYFGVAGVLALESADMDGDGREDLVAGVHQIFGNAHFAYLRGLVNGGFADEVGISVSGTFRSLGLVDLDDDGDLDVLGTDTKSNRLVVALAVAPGEFQPLKPGTGSAPFTSVEAYGDLNGDGLPDLVAREGNGHFSALGRGDGTFEAPETLFSASDVEHLLVADFDGDFTDDVAIFVQGDDTPFLGTYEAEIRVFPGLGDGSVGTFHDSVLGANLVMLETATLADLDENGTLDLVVSYLDTDETAVLLGNGDGTFGPAATYVGAAQSPIAIGDVNGDGVLDFVVRSLNVGFLRVRHGVGDGTFSGTQTITTGAFDEFWVLEDLNDDGALDLASYQPANNGAVLLRGNGDGTFSVPSVLPAPGFAIDLVSGDWNGDGAADLVLVADQPHEVVLVPGNGDGTFQSGRHFALAPSGTLHRADFDGDGVDDLALSSSVLLSRVLE